jgi:hypothetical protein
VEFRGGEGVGKEWVFKKKMKQKEVDIWVCLRVDPLDSTIDSCHDVA